MPDTRYCPNCDRPVTITMSGRNEPMAQCLLCKITWEGVMHITKLPTYPIGDEERESAFHRAKWRARLS